MKKYHLKVLYPSNNGGLQSFTKVVEATYFNTVAGGAHLFYNSLHEVIASYPANFTIIEKVEVAEVVK